ncbi:Smr/MutS family protein [Oceaniglobus indicus]|uniref:Smr/MutS family protein n=1 Tax=Oceaniglobus indicus TaxID=2047749 RepID=UPI001F4EE923|nr:Smr/MutS family protein [Oceaniglobus indicus]
MVRRKEPRRLSAEEQDLWYRVVGKTTRRPTRPEAAPLAETVPPKAVQPRPPIAPFQIGERNRDAPSPARSVPAMVQRPAQQPVAMDHKAFTRMKRGKLSVEGRIDLHGMTLDQAHPRLTGFIMSAHAAGKRLVLVITGKGKRRDDYGPMPVRQGILKHQVPIWLRSPMLGPIVLQVSEAHQSHGGSGAFYVYLRRNR